MKPLKVLEEENIHVIIGLGGDTDKGKIISAYAVLNRLGMERRRRRFTLHVVSPKPRPLYFEELRDLVLNNITYTLVIRYNDLGYGELGKLVDEIKSMGGEVYGIVIGDLGELARLFEEKNIPYERI